MQSYTVDVDYQPETRELVSLFTPVPWTVKLIPDPASQVEEVMRSAYGSVLCVKFMVLKHLPSPNVHSSPCFLLCACVLTMPSAWNALLHSKFSQLLLLPNSGSDVPVCR